MTHPNEFTWAPTHDRNKGTMESWGKELHEHAQSPPLSQLSLFYMGTCALGALTQHNLTHLNTFSQAPTHDMS